MSTPGPCASTDERDTQDTSLEEPRREHDTQRHADEVWNPTRLGGTRRGVQQLWATLAGLAALELRRRRSTVHAAPTKNEEK
jgi:hypothetical protein